MPDVYQEQSAFVVEDEDGEMVKQFPKPLVLRQQDSAEDSKKKKIFAR